jgi:hypothetical protein
LATSSFVVIFDADHRGTKPSHADVICGSGLPSGFAIDVVQEFQLTPGMKLDRARRREQPVGRHRTEVVGRREGTALDQSFESVFDVRTRSARKANAMLVALDC